MHPDLARLVRLQQIEISTDHARRTIADLPDRVAGLDARLTADRDAVEAARARLADNQVGRRGLERDLAAVQSRLAKFRDQLMEVRTNREYQAMQKEIDVAQHEVRAIEDRILERMLEADERTDDVKRAQEGLATEQVALADERRRLEGEAARLGVELERALAEREALVAELPAALLATFEQVARGRRGIAVAEAKDGLCSQCHVRLRPQVFNELRRNDTIHQCASCQRILYFPLTAEPSTDRATG
jgi:predicted  nucleic acid-binding Zn-ribbon protein